MRRSPLEEGRRWLEQAQEDLRWAEDLSRRGGYHIACFLAQQVGEKALKAFLYASGEEIGSGSVPPGGAGCVRSTWIGSGSWRGICAMRSGQASPETFLKDSRS